MFKKVLLGFILCLGVVNTEAQVTSVTATVVDSDGQAWNNGTWSASLFAPSGQAFFNGTPVPTASFGGSLSASGVLTDTTHFFNTATITPSGAMYSVSVCSHTIAACNSFIIPVTSSSQFNTVINASITAPRFNSGPAAYGYLDVEVIPIAGIGSAYFNVTDGLTHTWNGTIWTVPQSGGGTIVAAPQFQKTYYQTPGVVASVSGDTAATTDGAGNETAVSVKPNNAILALGLTAATATNVDFAQHFATSGAVQSVTVTNGGTYTGTPPTVTFSAAPSNGTTATGVAVLNAGGTAVVSVTLTNQGGGLYNAPPAITLSTGGATAVVSGMSRTSNPPQPVQIPWNVTQAINRRLGGSGTYSGMSLLLNLNSGTDNTNTVLGNFGVLGLTAKTLAPEQGGGMFAINGNCGGVGDCVGETMTIVGRGVSRNEDEGNEWPRHFVSNNNDVAGGTLTVIGAPDTQGGIPLTVTAGTGNSLAFYEKAFVMDVTKKFVSPGNIASIGTATNPLFSFFQGDGSAGITTQFGVSTQTTLTAAVDNNVYTGSCGSQTRTASLFPITGPNAGGVDGFMTTYQGVGIPGENTNYNTTTGALQGFCATVASTAGMSAGTILFIAAGDYQIEYTQVISVVDGTHFTAFFRSAHAVGATVNFGGAVGYCIGADIDIIPIGTNSNGVSNQTAQQRLCYPIVQSLAGDLVNVYTNPEGSSNNNLRTLLPAVNTPKIALVISAPVVTSGVLTSITTNANDYSSNTSTSGSGHPFKLPAPIITVSGCTVAPVIQAVGTAVASSSLDPYTATIVSGGSGCPATPTFNVASFFPTPFGIYPVAMVYKSEDPSQPVGTVSDGKFTAMPFNTSAWSTTDNVMIPDWWNGQGVSGQYNYFGNALHSLDGRTGPMIAERTMGVGSGAAIKSTQNEEPTSHYYGSFANNYNRILPTDYLVIPPIWRDVVGQVSTALNLASPPIIPTNNALAGGNIITVNCGIESLSSTTIDPPCVHGLQFRYNIFKSTPGTNGIITSLFNDPTTGILGVGSGIAWTAPIIMAYTTASSANQDVMLAGLRFGGINTGPCTRYDFLLASGVGAYNSSYGRTCGVSLTGSGSAGSLQFQVNTGGGATTYVTPLVINPTGATTPFIFTSTVATGTAPFAVTSTTPVANLSIGGNAATATSAGVGGVATLAAGTVTVSTAAACTPGTACRYKLTNCGLNASTAIGTLSVGTISVGTSFVINSYTALAALAVDTSNVCWQIN